MEAGWRFRIIRMAEKVNGEDSCGQARCRICVETGMDTAAEEMWDSNRRDVGQRRWINGLEERRRTGKYRQGTTTNLRAYC